MRLKTAISQLHKKIPTLCVIRYYLMERLFTALRTVIPGFLHCGHVLYMICLENPDSRFAVTEAFGSSFADLGDIFRGD